ncbi:MAG: hypothetical protein U0521_01285 [Anaerolineae bacterium]
MGADCLSRGMVMPAYPWALYRLMREHDVVSVHTPTPETALIAGVSALTGRNIVVTHHGDLILPGGLANRAIQAACTPCTRCWRARRATSSPTARTTPTIRIICSRSWTR